MKGQVSIPSTAIASVFITLLLLTLTIGNTNLTNQFIKSEVLDIKTDRVVNGIAGIDSFPEGSIQMKMEDYSVKVDEGNLSMNYSSSNVSRDLDEEPIQSDVTGPENYQKIEKNLCIRKEKGEISVETGGC